MNAKFNSLKIIRLRADFNIAGGTLEADAAFVNTETGETHGWTKSGGSPWGKDTQDAMASLKELLERDLQRVHFDGGDDVTSQTEGSTGLQPEGGGLGERLSAEPKSV